MVEHKKELYNNIRLLQHFEILQQIEQGHGPEAPPLHVRIEPTEACNFRCAFCYWHDPERKAYIKNIANVTGYNRLPFDRLLTLIDELAEIGTQAISFTGSGDPLMYPKLGQILKRIHAQQIKAGVTSNLAMPLDDETIEALSQCTWIRWSMNAGTPEGFIKTHAPREKAPEKAFHRAIENVKRLVNLKTDRHLPVHLNASFVIFRTNERDIYAAAQLAKNLGLASIAFRPDQPPERISEELAYEKFVQELIQRSRQDFDSEHFNVFASSMRLEDAQKSGDPDLVCFYSNHTTHIAANGEVYPCCHTRHLKHFAMGNILNQPFKKFWQSKKRREFYKQLIFDKCPTCQYGTTNEVLKQLYLGKATAKRFFQDEADKSPFI